jgi:hypothetical protein
MYHWMFRKFLYSILLFCFVLWLIPLGRFIDKAHESTACGGARAICLCCLHFQVPKPSPGKMITANTGHHEQRAPGGSAGYEFERLAHRGLTQPTFLMVFLFEQPIYSFLWKNLQDPVPKA